MQPANKTIKAVDLVRSALEKAQKHEEFHCFISMNTENALQRAARIDQKIEKGEPVGKLAGIPYALKDNFSSPDGNTTAASHMLENFQAPITATAVAKLEAEGAIMIGRTNLDSFAHGSSTENSYFGPTLNSHDKTRVAGGSSGGSAVAVALGIVPFALGSDTGGSIRQPASYNGVIGVKPTYGTVSRYGVVSMASSTDTIGCFTNTATDANTIMSIIAGKDEKDSTTLDDFWDKPSKTVESLRIGIISDFLGEGVDPEIIDHINNCAKTCQKFGAKVDQIELPILKHALAIYYIVQTAEVASNLSRYDGIRYGHRAKNTKDLSDLYGQSRDQGFMPENIRRIMIGNFVLSSGFFDAYYQKAQKARTLLINAYNKAFEKFDVLLCPVTPSPAFKLGEKTSDPLAMYLEDAMSVPPSVAGLPAISVPTGLTSAGLPVSAQLIGAPQSDRTLLDLAGKLEEVICPA